MAAVLCIASFLASPAIAAPSDDRFVAGYVAAILEREFGLAGAVVQVEEGIVSVQASSLGGHSRTRIVGALSTVPGVRSVTIVTAAAESPVPALGSGEPPAAQPAPADQPAVAAAEADALEILPRATLFESLRADPRWPHFSAAYHYYEGDPDAEHVGAVSFGESLSLVRGRGLGGRLELGFQAGVFSVFDLDSASEDLINADYIVGMPFAYRRGNFSSLLRLYHQSSHLGDEFLLREDTDLEDRINLSYEAVELLLSYDIGEPWRIYGGGGYLIHREPDSLERGLARAGLEYEGETLYGNLLRPVAAVDLQFWEHHDWSPDLSVRAGVQVGNPGIFGQQIEITAEYYNGRNPNGQFFTRDLEYFGLGLHLYFN